MFISLFGKKKENSSSVSRLDGLYYMELFIGWVGRESIPEENG